MRNLWKYFMKGLLIFVPFAITLMITVWFFTRLHQIFFNITHIDIPGLGLVVTLVFITIIGYVGSNYVGQRLFNMAEKNIRKLPLIKLLYNSIKDMVQAFGGEKKRFDKPVLVSLSETGDVKVIGFVTRESLKDFGIEDYAAVYMPQSYNFAGNLIIVPQKSITPIDIDPSKAMAFIISGGVSWEKNRQADSINVLLPEPS